MELISAAKDGNFQVAFSLITAGANLNIRDKDKATPLYWSACRGNAPLCEVLIQAGCDVNARVKWGSTALHAAVDRGHFQCVEILVTWGADIDSQNNRGDTPLHISAYRGFLEIVKYLVRAGANVLLSNENNRTPQEEAAAGGHGQVANVLLAVMEETITKQQNQATKSPTEISHIRNDLPKDVPGSNTPQFRYIVTEQRNLTSANQLGMFDAAIHLRSKNLSSPTIGPSKSENKLQRKPEVEHGYDSDSGVFYQENNGQFDSVDGVVKTCSQYNDRNIPAQPLNPAGVRQPVYRRSFSAQESSAYASPNNLHVIERDPYKTNFAGRLYNVPPELVNESEGASNSFDSSYMSSASDTSDSLNSTVTTNFSNKCVTDEHIGNPVVQELNPSRNVYCVNGNRHDRVTAEESSSDSNDVIVGLAQELTGYKQENKKLSVEKTVLEKKVISQQNVIKEIREENVTLRHTLQESETRASTEKRSNVDKPMTSHVELQKLLSKTKTFGMSSEEKEHLNREMQAYIQEHILSKAQDSAEPLDSVGREWTPGVDYVILGDKPLNKVSRCQKQRSLAFLIKHLKTGRKLVLKIMVNILNLHYQTHGDGFSMSTYLNEIFSPEYLIPEQLLEHAGVLKILHHYEGPTDRFKKFVNLLVNQAPDIPFEMANRSLFLVMDYIPLTLESLMSDINIRSSDTSYGSLVLFLSLILYQLLSLLDFIQNRNIVHRNLKCDNILLNNNLCPVLGGFGLAYSLNGSDGAPLVFRNKTEVCAGNDCAWAPELVHYFNHGPIATRQIHLKDIYNKSDVFALGQVFYSLLTNSKSELFYVNRLCKAEDRLPDLPSSLPLSLRHVLRQMLAENPAHRLTAKQAMHRIGLCLFPPAEKEVTCETDSQSYCNAKLLQILATESCCFRLPEARERITLEENIRLLRPHIEAHFLCNISPKEFLETLQDLRSSKVLPL